MDAEWFEDARNLKWYEEAKDLTQKVAEFLRWGSAECRVRGLFSANATPGIHATLGESVFVQLFVSHPWGNLAHAEAVKFSRDLSRELGKPVSITVHESQGPVEARP